MNPGTVLFIVLGTIGLLIYISKSLKPSSLENFAVIDESQISNKGKEGLEKLKDGTMNLESLFGAFRTPEISVDGPSRFSNISMPSVADFARAKKPQETGLLNMNETISKPLPTQPPISSQPPENLAPVPATKTPVIVNKTPALPVMTPASLITMPDNGAPLTQSTPAPITISDVQGTVLKKSAEPFQEERSYKNKKPKRKTKIVYMPSQCPKMPDMSQYIRKDSIPCWGCNLK